MPAERVAIVTGAGGGIGRAIALRLGRDGFAVVCTGRSVAALEETSAAVQAAGGSSRVVHCDVTDSASVGELEEQVGPVEVLVCNSGIAGPDAPIWTVDDDGWAETLDVNLTGVFRVCRAFLPGMIERRRGSIVAIGSVSGGRPLAGRAAYAASKLGLVGLMRGLSSDASRHGVRANVVSPGATAGDRIERVLAAQAETQGRTREDVRAAFLAKMPSQRFVEPDEVAGAVSYLAGDEGLGVAGIEIVVAGGGFR